MGRRSGKIPPAKESSQIPNSVPSGYAGGSQGTVDNSILTLESHSEIEAFWSGVMPGWVTAPIAAITHPSPLLVQQPIPKPRTLDEVLSALATQDSEKDAIPAPTTPLASQDPATAVTFAHTLSALLIKPYNHWSEGRPRQDSAPASASSNGTQHQRLTRFLPALIRIGYKDSGIPLVTCSRL